MSGATIINCPSCGRLIFRGQKCVCGTSIVTVEVHAGECFRCPGAATWYWHGEEDPSGFTVACEVCGETTFGAGEGRIK